MIAQTTTLLLTQADSARAIATVYTVSLLATLPLIVAGIASFALRCAGAQARVLVWRSAVIALLVLFIGRQLPLHAFAWAVPATLAAPLIALGRVQVTAESVSALRSIAGAQDTLAVSWDVIVLLRTLLVVYLVGVSVVVIPTIVATLRFRRFAGRASSADASEWPIDDARSTLGIHRAVRLLASVDVSVPMTWGVFRPVVLVPACAKAWNDRERRMVLLHELAHVRSADWAFNVAARVVCAVFWFHPGAWWIARAMRADCEVACDDRVIRAGVRRSDYAELLVNAAEVLNAGPVPSHVALALSERSGLRGRLTSVLDVQHDVRPIARGWAGVAAVVTLVVACPTSAVQLAPSRDVLTTLMADARWESRAYAVMGLAKRQDSVAVARSAAEQDPSPRVRAWARYALGQSAAPSSNSAERRH
jgi:beta-lactamase regulating signal transducer with metallopeptidase domain